MSRAGWANPRPFSGTSKWHFFEGGRSLCSRWMYFGEVDQGQDDHPDNCTVCRDKRAKKLIAENGQCEKSSS